MKFLSKIKKKLVKIFYTVFAFVIQHKTITAVIMAIIAAVIAAAILVTSILSAPASVMNSNLSSFKSNFSSQPEIIVSSQEEVSSDETPVSSDESHAEPQPESSTVETVTSEVVVTPPANTPTDVVSVQPIKSRHEVSEESESFNITLSFAGDMILATNNYQNYEGSFNSYAATHEPSYFLEKVRPIFESDDFTIVNLENVLTDRQLTPVYKDYSPAFWFGSKSSNINILSCSGIEGAMIDNNHIRDYGAEGYNDTVQAIKNAGMIYGDSSQIMYFEKGGYVISVICSKMWSEYQANNIINLIKIAEQHSHYQVVLFHGGTEKIHAPEEWKCRAARKIVDNGADLVIGGHPHVLQPREIYNGAEIVYSIGNFCYGGHRQPENRTIIYQMTLTVGRDLTLQSRNSEIIPCYVYTSTYNNYQPAVVDDETIKNRILDFMDGKIDSPV